jgi:hypothetical protein
MPATLYLDDLTEIPLFKKIFNKIELQEEKCGIQLGEAKILIRQLKKRFGNIA